MWWWTDLSCQLSPPRGRTGRDSYQQTARLFTSLLNSSLCSAQPSLCPSVPSRKPKYLHWTYIFLIYLWELSVINLTLETWNSSATCSATPSSVQGYVQGIKTPTNCWYTSYDFSQHLILIISKYQGTKFSFFPTAHISVKRKTLSHLGRLAFFIQTYHVIQLVVYIFFLKHPGPLDGCRSSYKNLLY